MNWFRYEKNTCPTCRDKGVHPATNTTQEEDEEPFGLLTHYGYYYDNYQIYLHTPQPVQNNSFAYASRQARNKDAPKALAKLYDKYKEVNAVYKEHASALSKFVRSDDWKIYTTIRKQYYAIRRDKFKSGTKLKCVKKQLCSWGT